MGGEKPDPADEIMLYQMIVGAWPVELDPADAAGCQTFVERLAVWQQKALREAKLRTDWTAPNETYEKTAKDFLFRMFADRDGRLRAVRGFVDTIAPAGAVNGLTQTVLKMTVPGVPDFFQGTEFWDLSLVDPDNRRPVDHRVRRELAGQSWRDGRIKQDVIHKVLTLRRQTPDLFARGGYNPLPVKGPLEDHVIAFTRTLGQSALLVVVPRLVHRLLQPGDCLALDPHCLKDSALLLPEQLHGRLFRPVLADGEPITAGPDFPLLPLLTHCPTAVLTAFEST
jgi:(1->4)-alpha-D-glucan 1-alpha-D-glucosylmutase